MFAVTDRFFSNLNFSNVSNCYFYVPLTLVGQLYRCQFYLCELHLCPLASFSLENYNGYIKVLTRESRCREVEKKKRSHTTLRSAKLAHRNLIEHTTNNFYKKKHFGQRRLDGGLVG